MRFVIIASPRTGSTHLTALLHSQSDIFCNNEVFHKQNIFVRWPRAEMTPEVVAELEELKRNDPKALMERVYERNFGRANVGFKIFSGHNDKLLKEIIADSSIRKIVLYRRNVLANYSSLLVATKTGSWRVPADKAPPQKPKIEFDAEAFKKFHDGYMRFYQNVITQLNAARQIYHFLNYEDISDSLLLSNTISFIGGNPVIPKLKTTETKDSSSNIVSRFSNKNEVKEFLRDHALLHWTHEGETTLKPFASKAVSKE